MADTTTRDAIRHARWRWTGAPLLATGIVLLLWSLGTVSFGGSGPTVLLSLFGTGMALASFGANHDTALALALKVKDRAALPTGLRLELEEELERDRSQTLDLRPAPRIALALPLVALAVQAWVVVRLFG